MSPVLGKKGEGQRSRGHREQWPPECIIDIRGYTAAGLLCLLNFEVDKSFARSYPGSSSPLPDFRSSRHDCALMNSITIGAGELKIWYNFFWMRCTLVRPHQSRACSTARGEAELSCTTSDLRSHVPTVIHRDMYRRYTAFKVFVSTAQGPCNSAICARCCLPAVAPTQHILMMAKSPRCVTPPTIAGWQSVDRIVLFDYLTTKGGQRINFRLSRPTEGQRRML